MAQPLITYMGNMDEINAQHDNVDVYVTLGANKYFATFFTPANIVTIMGRHRASGESLGGKYFWATDMCIVERIEPALIEYCIGHMLETGEFYSVFCCVDGCG